MPYIAVAMVFTKMKIMQEPKVGYTPVQNGQISSFAIENFYIINNINGYTFILI